MVRIPRVNFSMRELDRLKCIQGLIDKQLKQKAVAEWSNGFVRVTRSALSLAARSWLGKIGLGIMVLALLATVAYLNPIRQSDVPKAQAVKIYDQEISIPKVLGGEKSMRPLQTNASDLGGQLGVLSRWTAIKNDGDPGQLLIDLADIHLWRKIERNALFQYIPKAHTIDENRNLPILYELVNDSFECAEGMAEKISLVMYYEDGAQQTYYPWRYPGANEWIPVRPDTTLRREMDFVCAVELTTELTRHSPLITPSALDVDRILGTWRVGDDAHGRVAAGPITISDTQVTWTAPDSQQCTSEYQLASRNTGSTFPGGPLANDESDDAYTTFVLELKGPHLIPCSQKMSSLTISFASTQRDLAHFTAFFFAPQGYGTMRRVLEKQ
jgi:hypothetical protein